MLCTYDFVIAQHALDGLALAMRSRPALVLASPGGPALSRLLDLPEGAPTLEDLLRMDSLQPGQGRWQGHRPALLLASEDGPLGYAEVLDRGRRILGRWERVAVILSYARVERDLPPLRSDDTLQCFWEVRDLLSARHSECLQALGERLQHDRFEPPQLQLYLRHPEQAAEFEERHRALQEFAPGPLIQL